MAAFLCFYQSITFWYPTLIADCGRATLPYLVALNFGAVVGNVIWGRLSETRAGRRGAGDDLLRWAACCSCRCSSSRSSTPLLLAARC